MTIRTILMGTDFSNPAKAAARQAALLAKHFGAQLKLLHVLPYPLALPGAPDYGLQLGEWFTGIAEQDTSEMESFFSRELKAVHVDYLVFEGDPARWIVDCANANKVDLVVMPAHGQGPFRRFLLGSVTAKVLNDLECPVWTGVHREDLPCSESLDINTVVCAVKSEPESVKLIRWASEAAASFNARLFIVHVMPGSAPGNGEYARADLNDPTAARALKDVQALKVGCGVEAEVIIACGEIRKAVCSGAEQLNADLLIIGRSPQSGLFGRLPTNAYAIVRDSHCPVVSV